MFPSITKTQVFSHGLLPYVQQRVAKEQICQLQKMFISIAFQEVAYNKIF